MTRRFLAKHGIDFEERDVDVDENGREMLERSGQMSTPVTFVGDRMIIGFNEPELRAALAAEGIDLADV